MMARSKFAQQIADLVARGECSNGTFEDLQVILGGLDSILEDMLEPMERKVFQWIVENEQPTTSNMVSKEFGIQQNHASMILSGLCDLYLLDRHQARDGKYFVYNLHGEYEAVK